MTFPLAISPPQLTLPGALLGAGITVSALLNSKVAGIYTIAIPSSPTAGVHTITLDDVSVSYTAASGATQATVGAALAAAMNGDGQMGNKMTATYASGTLTVTARRRGEALTITFLFAGGSLTNATEATTPSAGSFVPAGRLLVSRRATSSSTAPTRGAGMQENVAPPSAGLTGTQVVTKTITTATGAKFAGTVRLTDGTSYNFGPVAHNTNAATTATDIVTAANAALPSFSVDVARPAADGVITFTAEAAGEEFEVDLREVTGTASSGVADTSNTVAYANSVARGLFGIAAYGPALVTDGVGGTIPGYQAASAVQVVTDGEVGVTNTESIIPGGSVYSDSSGRVFAARASGRFAIPRSKAVWGSRINSNTATIKIVG